MKTKSIVITVAFLLVAQFGLAKSSKPEAPKETSAIKTLESLNVAPDFSLKGQDGKTYSLKDYKGKVVVLEWFNNDCPFVEKHYGTNNMQKLQEKYTSQGAVWFSVSSTKPEQALKAEELTKIYGDRKSKATAILIDSNGDMARAYGAKTTPHMFVINADGSIAYTDAIDNNDSFSKDAVAKAKNYVAEALDVLLGKDKTKTISVPQTKPYGCSVKIGASA
jgi:peroxiredoxin